jgi:hypothetical protein
MNVDESENQKVVIEKTVTVTEPALLETEKLELVYVPCWTANIYFMNFGTFECLILSFLVVIPAFLLLRFNKNNHLWMKIRHLILFEWTNNLAPAPVNRPRQKSHSHVEKVEQFKETRVKQPYDFFLVLDVEATCEESHTFDYPNEIIVSTWSSQVRRKTVHK